MDKLTSRKFFLILSTIIAAFVLSYVKDFDPTMLVSASLGFYFGANVYQKINKREE